MITFDVLKSRIQQLEANYEYELQINDIELSEIINDYIDYEVYQEILCGASSDPNSKAQLLADATKFLDQAEKEVRLTVDKVKRYGLNSDNSYLYEFFQPGEFDLVQQLMEGRLGNVARILIDKFSSSSGCNVIANVEDDTTIDEIKKKYGNDYNYQTVGFLISSITTELKYTTSRVLLYKIKEDILTEFDNKISFDIADRLLSATRIDNIVYNIGACTLLNILNIQFNNIFEWPYKNNLLRLISNSLHDWNFSPAKLSKMQLMNCKKIDNISISKLIFIETFKRIIEESIEYNKTIPWVFDTTKGLDSLDLDDAEYTKLQSFVPKGILNKKIQARIALMQSTFTSQSMFGETNIKNIKAVEDIILDGEKFKQYYINNEYKISDGFRIKSGRNADENEVFTDG